MLLAWKIRFTGFGQSDYSGPDAHGKTIPYGLLRQPQIDVNALAAPPFYQPQGLSHVGGSFADVACVCNMPGRACSCKDAAEGKDAKGKETEGAKPLAADLEVKISAGCGVAKW